MQKKRKKEIHRSLPYISHFDISAAAISIPLMLYPWHDRRHVIVGQMADYTNPHYSSWWGWNLAQCNMNLVFPFFFFFCCSPLCEMSSLIIYNPLFKPLYLWKPSFSSLSLTTYPISSFLLPKLLMGRERWDMQGESNLNALQEFRWRELIKCLQVVTFLSYPQRE